MTPPDQAAADYAIATHETGHLICAVHFKVPARIELFASGEGPVDHPALGGRLAGVCICSRPGTKFQRSVISWAGILAELVAGVPNPTLEIPYPLVAKNLRVIHSVILANFDRLSLSDQTGIVGYPSNWTTFKTAWKILRYQKAKLHRLASAIVKPASVPKSTTETPAMKQEQIFNRIVPRSYRALLVQEHLSKLAADDPEKPLYEAVLTHLKNDIEPEGLVTKAPAQSPAS